MGLNETKRLANKKIKNKLVLRIIKDKTFYIVWLSQLVINLK